VVAGDRTAPPTLEALREHVKASLPPYAAPTVLDIVDVLPRTRSGKVRRA
jgi:acyl-coenzyme A synthetase/AMP-(fatty) acid ligase